MKSRYLYLAAGCGFLIGAILEVRPPRNTYPAVLDLIAAAIFFFLGFVQPKPRAQPTRNIEPESKEP